MPHVCAFIYAKNGKRDSYTGCFKDIPKTGHFDHEEFILAHALPGPDSVINSISRKRGKNQVEVHEVFKKDVNVSQIPGFVYKRLPIPQIKCPRQWEKGPISSQVLQTWTLAKMNCKEFDNATRGAHNHSTQVIPASWEGFKIWCSTFEITKLSKTKS